MPLHKKGIWSKYAKGRNFYIRWSDVGAVKGSIFGPFIIGVGKFKCLLTHLKNIFRTVFNKCNLIKMLPHQSNLLKILSSCEQREYGGSKFNWKKLRNPYMVSKKLSVFLFVLTNFDFNYLLTGFGRQKLEFKLTKLTF